MLVRVLVLVVAALGFGVAGAGSSPRSLALDEQAAPPAPLQCGADALHGPSLDDPNVDTDPDRPITHKASFGDDGDDAEGGDEGEGDQSDNDADGQCRSESLELQFQQDPDTLVLALADIGRAQF